jgi:nicotinamide-nucleotide adenylyltransferase
VAGRALFVGRFQPPHWGHMRALEWISSSLGYDEIVVVIGSAQESHTLHNPFTASERFDMLIRAAEEAGINARLYIVPVPDIAMNFVWARYLEMLVPRFETVVTRNPLVARLFREYGYRVVGQPLFDRGLLSATRIREAMLSGGEWKRFVPRSVAEYIEEIKGVERLREIASRD